jgi:hypothetical protein
VVGWLKLVGARPVLGHSRPAPGHAHRGREPHCQRTDPQDNNQCRDGGPCCDERAVVGSARFYGTGLQSSFMVPRR